MVLFNMSSPLMARVLSFVSHTLVTRLIGALFALAGVRMFTFFKVRSAFTPGRISMFSATWPAVDMVSGVELWM